MRADGGWTRGARLLCAAMAVSCTASAASQTPAPILSGALRAHVADERFGVVTSVRGLPLGVRDELETLFGDRALEIAEPGAEFQSSDVAGHPKLPIRRLVAAGCSIDHCLVYYERGGVAHTWHLALFHWTPDRTRLEGGGIAPRNLTSVDEIRNALLSGAVRSPATFW